MAYAAILHWHGPVPMTEAAGLTASRGWCEGFYMAVGRMRPWRIGPSVPRYIGISRELNRRLDPRTHHKLCYLSPSSKVWIGIPQSQFDGRRNDQLHRLDMLAIEHALAFLLRLPLNVGDREEEPGVSVAIFNHFFEARTGKRSGRPHPAVPDVVECDAEHRRARLVWLGEPLRQKTLPHWERIRRKKGSGDPVGAWRRRFWAPEDYRAIWGPADNTICPVPERAA